MCVCVCFFFPVDLVTITVLFHRGVPRTTPVPDRLYRAIVALSGHVSPDHGPFHPEGLKGHVHVTSNSKHVLLESPAAGPVSVTREALLAHAGLDVFSLGGKFSNKKISSHL